MSVYAASKRLPTSLGWTVFCIAVIVFSVAFFVFSSLLPSYELGSDLNHFYTAGLLWNEGNNPYDYAVFLARLTEISEAHGRINYSSAPNFYPPQAMALFSSFAHFSFETAHGITLITNLALLGASLAMLAHTISWYKPVGLVEVMLLMALVNTGYGRGNIREGQLGIAVFALLLAAFILAHYKRDISAGVFLAVVSIKPTFLPVYVGYYLLRRSYSLIAVVVVIALLLTFLPLLLTERPVVETVMQWVQTVIGFNTGTVNDPSPQIIDSASLVSLEPIIYRIFNVRSTFTSALVWVILAALGIYTAYLMIHSHFAEKQALLDFGLVSALSLLMLYHRSYDLFLLIPGVICLYLHTTSLTDRSARNRWAAFLTVVIVTMTLPGDLFPRLTRMRPDLQSNYLWRVISPYQAWMAVAVLAALLWLKRRRVTPPGL